MDDDGRSYTSLLAHFYDELFAVWGKDYQKESHQLQALIQAHKRSSGNTLLDVGCGTGEHIRYLQGNYRVFGIDLSREMLAIAARKFPNITFFHQDMSDFELDERFDVIVSLFSAIGYVQTLPKLIQTIACIGRHLLPGGIAIIEPWFTPEDFSIHRYDTLFGNQDEVKACRMRESVIENNAARITEHILVSRCGHVTCFTSKHVFGLFSESDFQSAFDKSQLESSHIEGGLTGRGLYVARKAS